jgi:predicted KAP-like P-loop ATPase
MSQANEDLKQQILKNLSNNGFPMKKVSLPLEKLYEVAEEKGANLNDILANLETLGTKHQKNGDKILFYFEMDQNSDQANMFAQAQEMMSKMSPEELQNIKNMVENMSPEERAEMMEKAKKMGLTK